MNKKLSIFAFTILFTLHASAVSVIYKYQNLAENISHPWGIAVIDENNILFTELTGALRIIEDGVLSPEIISGVPDVLFAGQAGLSDVVLDPNF